MLLQSKEKLKSKLFITCIKELSRTSPSRNQTKSNQIKASFLDSCSAIENAFTNIYGYSFIDFQLILIWCLQNNAPMSSGLKYVVQPCNQGSRTSNNKKQKIAAIKMRWFYACLHNPFANLSIKMHISTKRGNMGAKTNSINKYRNKKTFLTQNSGLNRDFMHEISRNSAF